MDRKTILALVIIGLIFVGYMYLFTPKPVPPSTTQPVDSTLVTDIPEETPTEQRSKTTPISITPAEVDSFYSQFDSVTADTVMIETDKYVAKFYGRGANLVSFKLKEYSYHNGDTAMVEMLPPGENALTFQFNDAGGSGLEMKQIVFQPNKTNIIISGGSTDKLIFRADLNSSDYIEISYDFYGDRYDFGVRIDFEGVVNHDLGESYVFGWESGLESTEKNRQDDFNSFRASAMWDTGLEKYKKFKHGQMSERITGAAKWISTKSKYFFVGIDPERDPAGAIIEGKEVKVNTKANEPGMKRISVQLEMPIHSRKSNLFDKFNVYIGPIDYNVLKSYNNGFENDVDMGGILKPISLGLLWLMNFLYSFLGNYGLVIIIFSILMKAVFYPLTSRSLKSMKRMQELQPKLKAIQERLKSDPQKMNAEVMKLWKENKVNPMGGCLLMLPQLPIFYALFTVFRSTILLRGSEFALWIKDLSTPDSTMILPLIMGLTMFLQQKMTMQDPKQKMLVYILPVVFFFLFKGFSSGLVLYWTMFNILSVAETILIKRPQQKKEIAVKQ
jgi:YidC/Oxa1 family membrane protein insertase